MSNPERDALMRYATLAALEGGGWFTGQTLLPRATATIRNNGRNYRMTPATLIRILDELAADGRAEKMGGGPWWNRSYRLCRKKED